MDACSSSPPRSMMICGPEFYLKRLLLKDTTAVGGSASLRK
jgi:hypothetical protein